MPQILCPTLVGRAPELTALARLLDGGGAAFVIGEAGIGKSRAGTRAGGRGQSAMSDFLTQVGAAHDRNA
ncbi:MAG TPA: hypothetical protein VM367_00965, partial [Pseudonocardia sp.]|nr:hypothetical protein [Pseudonocardia sp.]